MIAPACEYCFVLIVVGETHFHANHWGNASHLMMCFCAPKIKRACNLSKQRKKDIGFYGGSSEKSIQKCFPIVSGQFCYLCKAVRLTLAITLLLCFSIVTP